MGMFTGNPKAEPMHYGEVFGAWSYLLACKACYTGYQVLQNHTGDKDLKKLLEEAISTAKEQGEQVEELLKVNGVALPPTPPERPKSDLNEIPVGARIGDPEISAMLGKDTAASLVACSSIMGESMREDIAAMFGQFHIIKAQFGLKILRLNKNKGWVVAPPLHQDTPTLSSNEE